MTTVDELDRLLEDVLMDDAPGAAPTHVLSFALDSVAERPQRHPMVAWLDREAWPRTAPVVARVRPTRSMVLILLAMLLLLTATILAVGGAIVRRIEPPVVQVEPPVVRIETPGIPVASFAAPTLVYGRQDGGLFVAGADGSDARPILARGWFAHPRLSTDRRWIAADAAGTLGRSFIILRPDGSVAIEFPASDPVRTFAWGAAGPSAGWLAAATYGSIVVVDPASGARVAIDTGEVEVQALAWSPDAPILWWAGGNRTGLRAGMTADDVHAVRLDETAGTLQITDERSFVLELDPARTYRALEQMAVSPDGRTLAFRVRTEGWLRSDLIIVDAAGGAPTYLNPPPPRAPWLTAWSGIRWLPDGSGVVAEVGDTAEGAIVRPTVIPIDGSPPRPIDAGPLTVDDGGVVETVGPVLPNDSAVLVGGARTWLDLTDSWQVSAHDLWVADADGRGSHRVATGTLGGDIR